MRYYVAADVHGYYTLFRRALRDAGYDDDPAPHKLILLGDLFDRGREAVEMQEYVLGLMERHEAILIRGNHEDLFETMVTADRGLPVRHHESNGTYDTALQLTGFERRAALENNMEFARCARETPFYRQIIPATVDYYETRRYVFVHGWIPGVQREDGYVCDPDWRNAGPEEWRMARWVNGMDAAMSGAGEKTILCGHWQSSYGHAKYEHKGTEFGPDADFSPYYGPGVIALDACTAWSGRINVIVLEDEPLS